MPGAPPPCAPDPSADPHYIHTPCEIGHGWVVDRPVGLAHTLVSFRIRLLEPKKKRSRLTGCIIGYGVGGDGVPQDIRAVGYQIFSNGMVIPGTLATTLWVRLWTGQFQSSFCLCLAMSYTTSNDIRRHIPDMWFGPYSTPATRLILPTTLFKKRL